MAEPTKSLTIIQFLPLLFSAIALVISGLTFYLNFWRRSTKALLVLNSRLFGSNSEGSMDRELSYTISNIGNQELYVKEINYFYGKSPLGPYQHKSPFYEFPSTCDEIPVIIKPREIKAFVLKHGTGYSILTPEEQIENKYCIVFLEVFSANGKRYEFVHDITELSPSDISLEHTVWKPTRLKKVHKNKIKNV